MLDIIEIIKPAEQGKNMPYLCRGEDDQLYYVKGVKTTRKGQICEWICANLAKEFGLPMAPFLLVNIPNNIYSESPSGEVELGIGTAFASQNIKFANWYQPAYADKVPTKLKEDLLAFDWWIQNMDRMKDNPNLLWVNNTLELTVIDHDSAFGFEFFPTIFTQEHIFSDVCDKVFHDLVNQADYTEKMSSILNSWGKITAEIPSIWLQEAKNEEIPFDLENSFNIVSNCKNESFWSAP